MIKRQYNGRFKQQLNIRLVGLMWAMLAMMSIMALINPVPTSLIQLAFNHNPVAIGIFAMFTGGRGLIGLVQPKRYWRWFRAGVLNDAHNDVRWLSIVIATCAWIASYAFTPFFMPNWMIVWGVVNFLWILLPYLGNPEIAAGVDRLHDNRINPTTGLPMNGTFDSGGNMYGCTKEYRE